MNKYNGYSLIELVLLIATVSIAMVGVVSVMTTLLRQAPMSSQSQKVLSVAQARMELILGQHYFLGYLNTRDPCTTASPPAACLTIPSGYTVSSSVTPWVLDSDPAYALVSVVASDANGTKVTLKTIVSGVW
ncbi:MAG: type II secretion system protein [Gammaproteobacteria bacterium]|nr:type II secretion system protein [Gammaproteobacteria bacterium]